MSYGPEQLPIGWFQTFFRRRAAWIILVLLIVFAVFLRCVHLLNPNKYFLLTHDSYFFHWVAQGIMSGHTPPAIPGGGNTYTLQSGLAYPLAYIAKAISSVFNVSAADSLELASKFLPPVLSIISIFIIYLSVAKIYNRRVALFATLAWAMMLHAVYIGAGGYIDRDGLTILLMILGAFVFFFAEGWHFLIGKTDVGYIAAGLVVLGIEGALYAEWSFAGPVLLLTIIITYFVVCFLLRYFQNKQTELSVKHRFAEVVRRTKWQPFAVVLGLNILIVVLTAILYHHTMASWLNYGSLLVRGGDETNVQELQGLSLRDLLVYNLFLIPMIIGLYIALRKTRKASIFIGCWFLCMVILSIFAKRILIYAAPPACVLSGVGLASIWEWRKAGQLRRLKKLSVAGVSRMLKNLSVAALFFLLVLISIITTATLGGGTLSPDKGWQDALAYIREKTPQESVIMTQWSWGYWILDLGQRRPVVDNGYYGRPMYILNDIGLAYVTTDPAEAVNLLKKYGANYLLFSQPDQDVASTIMGWAGMSEKNKNFPPSSLVMRSLSGEFEYGDGLKVVYRSATNEENLSEVVILGLDESGKP